jgi:ribosomal protein L29
MKIAEIRKLSQNELVEKCNASVAELKTVELALQTGNLSAENVNKVRSLKKDVARMKTVLNELRLVSENEK